MADFILPSPQWLKVLQGTRISSEAPGLFLDPSPGSVPSSRLWRDIERRRYTFTTGQMSPAQLAEFEWFIRQAAVNRFSYVEAETRTHTELPLGPAPDGSRQLFRAPIYVGSDPADLPDVVITRDGVPVDSSQYTLWPTANMIGGLIEDSPAKNAYAQASLGDPSSYFSITSGTTASTRWVEGFGQLSYRSIGVTPNGTGATLAIEQYAGLASDAAVDHDFTCICSFFSATDLASDYKISIRFYVDDIFAGLDDSAVLSNDYEKWVLETHTAQIATSGSKHEVVAGLLMNDATRTAEWFFDGFAICPGDYDTWHLPTQAPMLVEFNFQPSAGEDLRISCDGRRWAELALDGKIRYELDQSGRATAQVFQAVEAVR